MNEFQAKAIGALNTVDDRNMELLDQVIDAAGQVADNSAADVTLGDGEAGSANFPDRIISGPIVKDRLWENSPLTEAAAETSQTVHAPRGDRMTARDFLADQNRLRKLAAEQDQGSGKNDHAERSKSNHLPDPE